MPRRKIVDDAHLWHEVARSVTRLSSRKKPSKPDAEEITTKETPPPAVKSRKPASNLPGAVPKPVVSPASPPALKPGAPKGQHAALDKRLHQRLTRGKLPIDGTIDLHGHRQVTAHRLLQQFIERAYAQDFRCVLVITGKGTTRSSSEAGILRQAVPRWLNEPALRPMILAIEQARQAHGGDGALYVLLRRRRS